MRQLSLFKGKRQKGDKPPSASEYELHCAVADTLRRCCSRDWIYTHIASGEYRTPSTAARLKRMGVNRGFPDFIFIGPGEVFFLELKREGGGLSEDQQTVRLHIMHCGFVYHWSDDFADILIELRKHGIVRASVSA